MSIKEIDGFWTLTVDYINDLLITQHNDLVRIEVGSCTNDLHDQFSLRL